jgi:hypothetical protein
MENIFQNLESNLVQFGYTKKHFGGAGIYPYILVNHSTNTSIGIKNDGLFYVSVDGKTRVDCEFETIDEVINFVNKF